ncbi:MAG: hypothetical protein U1F43_01120 [Myxococcota bacterium]
MRIAGRRRRGQLRRGLDADGARPGGGADLAHEVGDRGRVGRGQREAEEAPGHVAGEDAGRPVDEAPLQRQLGRDHASPGVDVDAQRDDARELRARPLPEDDRGRARRVRGAPHLAEAEVLEEVLLEGRRERVAERGRSRTDAMRPEDGGGDGERDEAGGAKRHAPRDARRAAD